ncbi:unnamed protein product [Periconia digitata]|uniref:Uncharacterized protein n=1 Tax=Periconia digitata TaxID=1303443 RepID=A0A9W4U976_9PLEO|nr:unnamed protein product [Periconia digitata]
MPEAQATPRVSPSPEPSSSSQPQAQQQQHQHQQHQQNNPQPDDPQQQQQSSSLKTPKDKNCPFCGQAFTSSSLGRHLDLYIRPKNPKPSDGLHIVEEIRKIRGGITRRQVKGPLKKERGDRTVSHSSHRHSHTRTPANKRQSVVSLAISGRSESPHDDDQDEFDEDIDVDDDMDDESLQDLSVSKRRGDMGAGANTKTPLNNRRLLQKVDLDQRHRMSDEMETSKAIELALRELLRSVKEANTKATSSALFDFDPYTLNFPSLCLRVLPPPSTLFSPTPFPTSESWSINPPGQKQFDTLNKQVRERLLAHQRQRQINQAYPSGAHSTPPSANASPLPTPPLFDPDPEKLFCHIADAFSHWMHQPEHARQEFWQVEILRSYARANDLRREAEMSLQHARRELEFYKAHRPGPELSPVSFTLGTETVRELGKLGMDFRNWDYDRLVEKWKTVVRENKNIAAGMSAQKPLPAPPSTRSCSMTSLPNQPFASGQGALPQSMSQSSVKLEQTACSAPPTISGQEPSSDQADAEGEDDDTPVDIEVVPASNNMTMNDHHHVGPHQPTPVHPSQIHAHLPSQVHVQHQQQQHQQQHMQVQHAPQLTQAQAHAWAVARQHMNHSRNSHHPPHPHPHQHQQLSPHPQHMGSAGNSRRQSGVLMDPHAMNTGNMLPMDGIENHPDQYLRLDMGLAGGYVGSNGDGV